MAAKPAPATMMPATGGDMAKSDTMMAKPEMAKTTTVKHRHHRVRRNDDNTVSPPK